MYVLVQVGRYVVEEQVGKYIIRAGKGADKHTPNSLLLFMINTDSCLKDRRTVIISKREHVLHQNSKQPSPQL